MARPTYPLQPLLEHRARGVDAATAELGGAVQRREHAETAERRAEAARLAVEREQARVREEERARLGRGELSVADLARGGAWEHAAKSELGSLQRAVEVAVTTTTERRGQEEESRDALARSMADRDVVAKDRARFVDRAKKATLAAEEEAAEEARRPGPGRGAAT